MKKFKVTFHRTYEIEISDENLAILAENKVEDIEQIAVERAKDYLSEDMMYYEANINDFVSYTVEEVL